MIKILPDRRTASSQPPARLVCLLWVKHTRTDHRSILRWWKCLLMSDLMTKVWQALYHTQTDGSTCFPEVAWVISGHETMGTGGARHWPALALTCRMPADLYKPALDTQPSSLTPSLIMADNKSRAVTTHSFSHAVNGLRVALWPLRSAAITPHSPISSGQRNNDLWKCWIALMKDIVGIQD